MGLGQTDLRKLGKLHDVAQFGFYASEQNWPHVLEWLEEVS